MPIHYQGIFSSADASFNRLLKLIYELGMAKEFGSPFAL